ncbi:MAG: helix-turn-helix domain-containing protein, partial [Acidobacteria bacterium]|nr:helix-turn-helix domain-containing protein [Acidobacteriota bacterium]
MAGHEGAGSGSRGPARRALLRSLYPDEEPRAPEWVETTLLRSGEVAALFQVSRRTVIEWARSGKLPFITTPGGHRRYPSAEVRAMLERASTP